MTGLAARRRIGSGVEKGMKRFGSSLVKKGQVKEDRR